MATTTKTDEPVGDARRRGGSRGRAALLGAVGGLLATLVGMALGHLVAALIDPSASPVLAVGATVIDFTPTPLKEWAIEQFGSNDKIILIGSVIAGALVLAAIAGMVARRVLAGGVALLLVLVALAGVSAMTRPTASLIDVLPAVVTAIAGVATLVWFTGSVLRVEHGSAAAPAADNTVSRPADTAEPAEAGRLEAVRPRLASSRRTVLLGAGALAVLSVAAGTVGQWAINARNKITDFALPTPKEPAPPLPTGLEGEIDGLTQFRTPNADFYRVDINLTVPNVGIDDWTLTVDGDVENELTITFDELLAMPMIERDITMTCVSNGVGGEYVGAARWLGVRLTDILDMAGVGDRADQILSTAVDGFTISTPLEVATDGRDAMIVVAMNGEPLPREHGYPVRMITPGIYGYVGSTKWLTKLTLTTYEDDVAYWTERDWVTDAPVKIASRIDVPRPLEGIDAGSTRIAGVAWAQQRGIAKVELSIDGGDWVECELGPDANVDYWRQWYYDWDATDGDHTVVVRATDGDGEVQTEERMPPFPEGSSGLQSRSLRVG